MPALVALPVALLIALAAPAIAAAHAISAVYESRLPLPVYLAGAAAAVGLSFAFVLLRDVRADVASDEGQLRRIPAWLRLALRAVGLLAWLWIIIQGTFGGGAADAEVTRLFLWVYSWVGLALLSAFIGPIWRWLDPFSTIHDLVARAFRTFRIGALEKTPLPEGLGRWPAVAGWRS